MVSQYINQMFVSVSSLPFDTLIWIIWGSFGAVFLVTLIMCFALPAVRSASKRPFLCLSNAYAAVTLTAFLTANELPQSVFAAVLFWCAGYFAYGLLCFVTKPAVRETQISQVAMTSLPVQTVKSAPRAEVPSAKSSVRLEHAISVTDKLLQKNLGKGDRQELEKLKNTLAVLQLKGTLSPTEADILNDNFNALLKLMAKYNV